MDGAGNGDIRIDKCKEHSYPQGIPADWAGNGDIVVDGGCVVERLAERDGQDAGAGLVGGRGDGRRDRVGHGHCHIGRGYGVA